MLFSSVHGQPSMGVAMALACDRVTWIVLWVHSEVQRCAMMVLRRLEC